MCRILPTFAVLAMKKKIPRDRYLKQLVDFQWDGQVKVVTGLRR